MSVARVTGAGPLEVEAAGFERKRSAGDRTRLGGVSVEVVGSSAVWAPGHGSRHIPFLVARPPAPAPERSLALPQAV